MPKSSQMDRTDGNKMPEGENTSDSGPTIIANHKIKRKKNNKVKNKSKDNILKGMFANLEFPLIPEKSQCVNLHLLNKNHV